MTGENLLQKHICTILDLAKLPYFAIPNGSNKSIGARMTFKATGLKSGVPDLFVCKRIVGYGGLFIEVKLPKGKQSPTQIEWEKILVDNDYMVAVVHSTVELETLLRALYPDNMKKFK